MKNEILALRRTAAALVLFGAGGVTSVSAQQIVHVPLSYRAPREGVTVRANFSPKGKQVELAPAAGSVKLPEGAVQPVKSGVIQIGPTKQSWIPLLASASPDAAPEHRQDLTQLWLDRNRNGSFLDDGPPISAALSQNPKTKAWSSSINKIELSIPYPSGSSELYFVNFWMVRDDTMPAVDIIRYSTGSWRYGTAVVKGVPAVVAAFDDNDAVFRKGDMWSVLGAAQPKAESAVLSINEARETNRLMFVPGPDGKDIVLEFRSFAPDGSSIDFAVVDKPVSKAQDRLPDDMLREERGRPRTPTPVTWKHGSAGLADALAAAKDSGKRILIDFEATWCGPCHTMDDWIWTDAEVADLLNRGYIGVKIDVDLEKPLVARYRTVGYPTMIVLDSNGVEILRHMDYMSSKQILPWLALP